MSRIPALVVGAALLTGCASAGTSSPTPASANLKNALGQDVGHALFTPTAAGVQIVVEVQGLPPGPKAVHLHETGVCAPPAFASAGGHVNPERRQHGADNPRGPHAGDLPNLVVGADGAGRLVVTTARVSLARSGAPDSLLDGDGSALVVHAGGDDMTTDPTGNSGARIACGVVTPAPAGAGPDVRPAPRTGY
jgi:Cu-Zn family superoxide dismutase